MNIGVQFKSHEGKPVVVNVANVLTVKEHECNRPDRHDGEGPFIAIVLTNGSQVLVKGALQDVADALFDEVRNAHGVPITRVPDTTYR